MPLREPVAFSNRSVRDRRRASVAGAASAKSRPDSQWTPQAYLTQVRHLRQRYAGNPAMLQRALSELSRNRDLHMGADRGQTVAATPAVVRAAVRDAGSYLPADSQPSRFARAVVDWFANHVAQQIDEKLLHFSRRQELLATADRLGIGRFHANLIIAVAQHHAGEQDRSAPALLPKARSRAWPIVLTLAAIQAGIVWAGWRVLHG